MRNFGTLHGRVSRGLSTQAALRYYPSPLYNQQDTGYVFGTYGNPVPNPHVNQSSMFYAEQYHQRDTNKYDAWSSAFEAVGDIGTSVAQSVAAVKTGQIMGGDVSTTSYGPSTSSGGSSTGLLIALGLGALAIGAVAFLALK